MCLNENKAKDRRYGDPLQASYSRLVEGAENILTDKEDLNFRYVY